MQDFLLAFFAFQGIGYGTCCRRIPLIANYGVGALVQKRGNRLKALVPGRQNDGLYVIAAGRETNITPWEAGLNVLRPSKAQADASDEEYIILSRDLSERPTVIN